MDQGAGSRDAEFQLIQPQLANSTALSGQVCRVSYRAQRRVQVDIAWRPGFASAGDSVGFAEQIILYRRGILR